MITPFRKRSLEGSVIAAATAAKGLFGLAISIFIGARIDATAAVGYFQLLTLQSTFITFISGSAFVRGARADHESELVPSMVRFQLGFMLASSLLAIAGVVAFLSPDYLNSTPGDFATIIASLLASAVFSTLIGLLQGLLVRRTGRARVFTGTIIGNLLGCVVLVALWFRFDLVSATALLAFVQAAIFLQLVIHPQAQEILAKALLPAQKVALDWSAAKIGLANTLFMAGLFAAREIWKNEHPPELAASVFLILRISDTLMQVPALFFGSSIETIRRWEAAIARSAAFFVVLATVGLLFTAAITALAALTTAVASASLAIVIAAQLIVDFQRLPATAANLSMLMRRNANPYVFAIIGSLLAAVTIAWTTSLLRQASGLYILLVLLSIGQIVGALVNVRSRPESLSKQVRE